MCGLGWGLRTIAMEKITATARTSPDGMPLCSATTVETVGGSTPVLAPSLSVDQLRRMSNGAASRSSGDSASKLTPRGRRVWRVPAGAGDSTLWMLASEPG